MPGFTSYFVNRKTNSCRGVTVFIKSKFVISSISTVEVKSFEHLELHIVNPYDIILSVIYQPPSNSCIGFQEDFATYITHLAQNATKSTEYIFTGDFNMDFLHYNNTNIADFINLIYSHNCYPNILLPTRIAPHFATIINNFKIKLQCLYLALILYLG